MKRILTSILAATLILSLFACKSEKVPETKQHKPKTTATMPPPHEPPISSEISFIQLEQQRVDDKAGQHTLVAFTQNSPLLPAVYPGGDIPWASENEWVVSEDQAWRVIGDNANVIDRFVTVENTGKFDIFVRTIFAVETPRGQEDLVHFITNGTNIKDGTTWIWEWLDNDPVMIDGIRYIIGVATYTDPLAPGDTTIPSLKQFYLDKKATNENCAKYGESYDILISTQAVHTNEFVSPTEALNSGYGKISSSNTPWPNSESVYPPTSNSLQKALAEGGKIILSSDIVITDDRATAKHVVHSDTSINFGSNTLTLDNDHADVNTENWIGIDINGGNVVFEGTNGGITTSANSELFCTYVRNGATLTINGGNYIGGGSCVQVREGTLIVNGGYFAVYNTDNNSQTDACYLLNCTDANYKAGTANIIVTGGSFLNWNPADNDSEGPGTNFVANGYTVEVTSVEDGTLYTVIPQ